VDHVQASLGAFYRTSLEKHLRDLGVNTLVVCGCNFPNCPRATIYEASERDLRIAFVPDATFGVYERGLRELENIGVKLASVDELSQKLTVEFARLAFWPLIYARKRVPEITPRSSRPAPLHRGPLLLGKRECLRRLKMRPLADRRSGEGEMHG
jgi:hypothetical protein